MKQQPLVLTLESDEHAASYFEDLRARHFPPELNRVPAHVSLFHHLPGEELGFVTETMRNICSRIAAPQVKVTGVRHLGRGAAFTLQSAELTAVHRELADAFRLWLTPQDRQPFRPHVTVQNKATASEASVLVEQLRAAFEPWTFSGLGLALWRYLDGPWEPVETVYFAA